MENPLMETLTYLISENEWKTLLELLNIWGYKACVNAYPTMMFDILEPPINTNVDNDTDNDTNYETDEDYLSILRFWLTEETNFNRKNNNHENFLHIAAKHCMHDLINDLLRLGCSPNCVSNSQETPLHIYAQHDFYYYTMERMVMNADITIKNKDGKTALELCNYCKKDLASIIDKRKGVKENVTDDKYSDVCSRLENIVKLYKELKFVPDKQYNEYKEEFKTILADAEQLFEDIRSL